MLLEAVLPDTGHIVVIASAGTVSAWRAHLDAQPNARLFSDRPEMIALDSTFAATARGAALVARVKADPMLCRSEVRTLVGDGLDHAPMTCDGEPEGKASIMSQPLDSCGTRRAPRYAMQPNVDAKVNGTACRLVNLSITGSQIVAPMRLRPSEAIRLAFSDQRTDLRLAGTVAWVHLEIADGSSRQRYRCGVEFRDADFQVLQQFCTRHRHDS
jgi:hypothetical protein